MSAASSDTTAPSGTVCPRSLVHFFQLYSQYNKDKLSIKQHRKKRQRDNHSYSRTDTQIFRQRNTQTKRQTDTHRDRKHVRDASKKKMSFCNKDVFSFERTTFQSFFLGESEAHIFCSRDNMRLLLSHSVGTYIYIIIDRTLVSVFWRSIIILLPRLRGNLNF